MIGLCFLIMLCLHQSDCVNDADNTATIDSEWLAFKTKFGKAYSAEEDIKRKNAFITTLNLIKEHNRKFELGEVGFAMEINPMADKIQQSEVSKGLNVPPVLNVRSAIPPPSLSTIDELPSQIQKKDSNHFSPTSALLYPMRKLKQMLGSKQSS